VPAVKSVVAALALVVVLATVVLGTSFAAVLPAAFDATPAFATVARDNVEPCADGRPPAPGERCTGPVDNSSGGGGGALTIAVSVVVGLAIAGVAFVVLRRQLATHRPPPPRGSAPGPREAA
jgi:hypothetical protein